MTGRLRVPPRPWFFKRDVEVVTAATARRRSAVSAALGALLCLAVTALFYQTFSTIAALRIPAMAVSPMLFQVGEYLCKKNEGLRRVEIVIPVDDRYTFVCGNGARFEDTLARIRRP